LPDPGSCRFFVTGTKIPLFVKKISIAAVLLAAFCCGRAQVTVKKDVTAYLRQLPAPPATLEDAYKNCNCVGASGTTRASGANVAAGVHDAVMADAKSMGALTNTENQQLQQAKTLYNQSQADNVKGMTKDQQLTWVQNNMQGYGNTPQAAAFAQKMQDPTEVARFKAMTPDQKLAYMKASGIDPMKGMAAPQTAVSPAADAESRQKQMQADLTSPQAGQLTGTLDGLLNGNGSAVMPNAQEKLTAMTQAYLAVLSFYERTDSAFGAAITAASYGYTGGSAQDEAVSKLSVGQTLVLYQVSQLETYLNRIYLFGAIQQGAKLHAGSH
jgi:hypothetical protein